MFTKFETIFTYRPFFSRIISIYAKQSNEHLERTLDIASSFLIGFVTMWIAFKIEFTKPICPIKESLVKIANTYGNNEKICKELKQYSMNQIKHGNYEYIEVFDTIKRQNNDKTRT